MDIDKSMDIPDIYNLDNFTTHSPNVLHININDIGDINIYYNDIIMETQIMKPNHNIINIMKYSDKNKYFYIKPNMNNEIYLVDADNKVFEENTLYEIPLYNNILIDNYYKEMNQDIYLYFYENNVILKNINMGSSSKGVMRRVNSIYLKRSIKGNSFIRYICVLSNFNVITSTYFKYEKFIRMIEININEDDGKLYFYMYKVNNGIILYLHKIMLKDDIFIFCIKNGDNIIHNYSIYMVNLEKLNKYSLFNNSIAINIPYHDKYKFFHSMNFEINL